MTLQSEVLSTMRERLVERLGGALRSEDVLIIAGPPGTELKPVTALGSPSMLLACLGGNSQPEDYGVIDAAWAAFIFVKGPSRAEHGPISASEFAGDLAFKLAGIVSTERWDGKTVNVATRIRVSNENQWKTAKEAGWSVWAVAWTQPFELLPDDAAEYARLASIHHTFVMGDEATPDQHATLVFPEPTP